jgi:hypothetical protein
MIIMFSGNESGMIQFIHDKNIFESIKDRELNQGVWFWAQKA